MKDEYAVKCTLMLVELKTSDHVVMFQSSRLCHPSICAGSLTKTDYLLLPGWLQRPNNGANGPQKVYNQYFKFTMIDYDQSFNHHTPSKM